MKKILFGGPELPGILAVARNNSLLRGFLFFMLSTLALFSCSGEVDQVELQIADIVITVEIADTDQLRAQGLMNRKSLKEDSGMLFVFKEEKKLFFWMKNTLIPLSIAYISRNGEIKEIHPMYPLDKRAVPSSRSVMYALEMNQGWFEKNNIQPGDLIIIPENL